MLNDANHVGSNKPMHLRVDLKSADGSGAFSTTTTTTTNSANGKGSFCSNDCNCFVAYLILGMVGFVLFWGILMLRIYLPERYWQWSYIWSSVPADNSSVGNKSGS